MANAVFYISASGSNTSPYDTWAKAASSTTTGLADAITASGTTGSDFVMDKTMTISNAGGQTVTFKGVAATPDRFFSATNTGSPVVAADIAVGANFTTTGAGVQTWNGYCYIDSMTFTAGTGSSGSTVSFSAGTANEFTLNNCKIIFGTTSTSTLLQVNSNTANRSYKTTFNNTTVKFASTSQCISILGGTFRWNNTAHAIDSTGSLPTTLFKTSTTDGAGVTICDSVDFSDITSKAITGTAMGSGAFQFINCQLPTGVTFGTPGAPGSAPLDFIVTSNSNVYTGQSRYMYQGTATADTTVYNNAQDNGGTAYSIKVVTSANSNVQSPFEVFDIDQWVAAGTYAASTVAITSADAALTNADIWVRTQYLGSASFPIGSAVTSAPATPLTAGSPLNSGTWATGAAAHNYVLNIPSFTTAVAGFVRFKIRVSKPTTTIWIDPAVTVA